MPIKESLIGFVFAALALYSFVGGDPLWLSCWLVATACLWLVLAAREISATTYDVTVDRSDGFHMSVDMKTDYGK